MGRTCILTIDDGSAVLADPQTDWAFGPIFESAEQAEAFLQWIDAPTCPRSLREMNDSQLEEAHAEFVDVWKYCGLTDEERRLYDQYEIEQAAIQQGRSYSGPDFRESNRDRLAELRVKVETNRLEKWIWK